MRKGNQVDVSTWGISSIEQINALIQDALMKATNECITYALESPQTFLTFPVAYQEPKVNDPLEVWMYLSLDNGNGNQPSFKTNLRDMLAGPIETASGDAEFDSSVFDGLLKVAKGLRELADEIDKAARDAGC